MMDTEFNSEWGSRQVSFNTKVDVQALKDMADIVARPMELSAMEHEDCDVDTVMDTCYEAPDGIERDVMDESNIVDILVGDELAEFEAELEEARLRLIALENELTLE
jgi:hypothetical protein